MTSVAFDTGLAVENLQQSGFDLPQARGVVEVMRSSQAELATKDDLDHAIELLRLSTKHDNEVLRRDMTIRLGVIVIAATGVWFTLLHLFPPGSLGG